MEQKQRTTLISLKLNEFGLPNPSALDKLESTDCGMRSLLWTVPTVAQLRGGGGAARPEVKT